MCISQDGFLSKIYAYDMWISQGGLTANVKLHFFSFSVTYQNTFSLAILLLLTNIADTFHVDFRWRKSPAPHRLQILYFSGYSSVKMPTEGTSLHPPVLIILLLQTRLESKREGNMVNNCILPTLRFCGTFCRL